MLRFVTGMSIFSLLNYLRREFLLIVSTSSSESALPRLIAKMEHLGVSRSVVGITVPTGYSFNLDGTAIYLTMASLFIAEALGKPLSIGEQISLLLFMIIASKGAAGVTGAGLATLAGGLQSHRPDLVDGVGLIVGIDRFMSEARALTNFAGNAVATVIIGKWVGEFDTRPGAAGCSAARTRSTRPPCSTTSSAGAAPETAREGRAGTTRRPPPEPTTMRQAARVGLTPRSAPRDVEVPGHSCARAREEEKARMASDLDPVETREWLRRAGLGAGVRGRGPGGLPARRADRRGPAQRRAGAVLGEHAVPEHDPAGPASRRIRAIGRSSTGSGR